MGERKSCFYNHREGISQFAAVKTNPLKTAIINESTKNAIIQMKNDEIRRSTIYALASA